MPPLSSDIIVETHEICTGTFTVNQGRVIPSLDDVPLGNNEGRQLSLVALFVDIRRSTALVNALGLVRSARMYKAYLRGVTKIVRARKGDILTFNGDGVAAGFVGDDAASAACLTALNLQWFLGEVLKPRVDHTLIELGADSSLYFDYGIGVETGDVLVVRGGVRGEDSSDLVWAGDPLNYAVKLSGRGKLPTSICISDAVFDAMHYQLFAYDNGERMWVPEYWTEKGRIVWGSTWWLGPEYLTTVPPDLRASLQALDRVAFGVRRRRLLPP